MYKFSCIDCSTGGPYLHNFFYPFGISRILRAKFKCMNGYAPEYLCDQFILRSKIHSRNTRNKDKLVIPLCKTAAGQKSFVYRATSIWNSLSQDLINLNNLNSFKRLNKLSLLEQ